MSFSQEKLITIEEFYKMRENSYKLILSKTEAIYLM